ncbi:MAG: MaoC family dehydratase N-terminal domain-containing protein [SAR202 cluster bacterium]|nr:MaoC family dehydratase N-terminal domain-containing protein [SAR202 cluster bacterium]MDP6713646.1 MaoC family dehydratase N-terminal domain-containing protein [SAR202 cluster bacterium]
MSRTPEEALEEARKLIDSETEIVRGRYPVEHDPIRRYCHMTDDTNPLFLDVAHAESSRYGTVISPPLLIGYFTGNGPWPPVGGSEPSLPDIPSPGDRLINLTTEWEFYEPVKVGDRLSYKRRLADVFIKGIRLDSKAFWVKTEMLVYNQDDILVAMSTNLLVRHRTQEQQEASA